jgi:hypothetical protein
MARTREGNIRQRMIKGMLKKRLFSRRRKG